MKGDSLKEGVELPVLVQCTTKDELWQFFLLFWDVPNLTSRLLIIHKTSVGVTEGIS